LSVESSAPARTIRSVIDLHAHVLPGVDDGPASLAESLEILRDAAADGVTRIAATPHVRDDYPTAPETMEFLVAELDAAAREAGIALDVLPGGELDLEFLTRLEDGTLRRFGLGGNPSLLLLEFPYYGWPPGLRDKVTGLRARGFTLVLAHPERNADVQEAPERLRPLVEAGLLVQLTAASVDGRLGRRTQACARTLLDTGLAHLVASDAHPPSIRRIGLAAAVEAVDDAELGHWLVEDVPAALLAGEPLPRRPSPPSARRRLWPR
jgi:protein-tyrosine phosphatase